MGIESVGQWYGAILKRKIDYLKSNLPRPADEIVQLLLQFAFEEADDKLSNTAAINAIRDLFHETPEFTVPSCYDDVIQKTEEAISIATVTFICYS